MQYVDQYARTQYDGLAVRAWLIDNVDIAVAVAGLYLTCVFTGPDLLERYVFSSSGKDRKEQQQQPNGTAQKPAEAPKPFWLKWSWAIWNLLLAVFSFYGSSHVAPVVIGKVRANGFHHTLCTLDEKEFYSGEFGMALGLFCLSKGPELIDTAFLLLSGKKRLPFLQWFHHVTTFLYCWHAYAAGSSALQFAASLNYSVHTVMYTYFFLAEAGFKTLVKPLAPYITVLQILQMIVGTTLTSMLISYKVRDHQEGRAAGSAGSCAGSSWPIARVQLFIAGVNLVLFCQMFVKAYLVPKKRAPRASAANGAKKAA